MNFQYVPVPVRGEGCPDEWDDLLPGCSCEGPCTAEQGCECLFGSEDNYQGNRLDEKRTPSVPIFECNSECACKLEACSNRLLQKGVSLKLKVSKANEKGFCVKAMEFIPKGTFICEYAGEIISEDEAQIRFSNNKDHNYIMTVKETSSGKTVVYHIDPTVKGNLARFINHSCEPNVQQVAIRVTCPVPRIGFFALRDIDGGEEITYSYGPSRQEGTKKCLCGTSSCLGYLPSEV